MSGNGIIPISNEQAELGIEVLKSGSEMVAYLADVVGDLPKDLVGILVGDRVKVFRAERLARFWQAAKKRLADAGVTDPEPPNLKIALPILSAAADETDETLQDIWARLLAASMDPAKKPKVRQRFVDAISKLDAIDTPVLLFLQRNSGGLPNNGREAAAREIGISANEFMVSFENLTEIGFVKDYNGMMSGLVPFGREFLKIVMEPQSSD